MSKFMFMVLFTDNWSNYQKLLTSAGCFQPHAPGM